MSEHFLTPRNIAMRGLTALYGVAVLGLFATITFVVCHFISKFW